MADLRGIRQPPHADDRAEKKYPSAAQETVKVFTARWLESRQDLRPRTRETYEADLKNHVLPELGDVKVKESPRRFTD